MSAMALVVPITPETDVEPRSNALLPVSAFSGKLFRRAGPGNAVLLPASSQNLMEKQLL
ncbi:hypothetical protein H0H93_003188 [Arthromyces matolae]|nr:hypothetical protein H0H93_003188 [Arthromyces matolae]